MNSTPAKFDVTRPANSGPGGGAALPISASTTRTARDSRSDYLKAAAILAVVAIHVGVPYEASLRYCVPVFVAIWAFFLELGLSRRHAEEMRGYLRSRFVRLLVPYIFWTLIYLWLLREPSEWSTIPLHTILGGWLGGYGWPGQYFFIILFQLTLLFPLLRRAVNTRSLWVFLGAGIALNALANYFLFKDRWLAAVGDRLCVYWIPYVCLGVAFARGYPRRWRWLCLPALLLLLGAPLELGWLEGQHDFSPYLALTVTAGSIALLLAVGPRTNLTFDGSEQRRPNRVAKLAGSIGQYTFPIYVGHTLLVYWISRSGFMPIGTTLRDAMAKAATVVLAVAGSLALGWAFRKLGLGILVGA